MTFLGMMGILSGDSLTPVFEIPPSTLLTSRSLFLHSVPHFSRPPGLAAGKEGLPHAVCPAL